MRILLSAALTLLVSLTVETVASAEEFTPSAQLDLATLEKQVLLRSPAVQQGLLENDLARAEARQARLLGNPTLDATWGTIPIGETNPAGLDHPLANVPNYSVGLSYTVPIGKRGPRRDRADALVEGTRAAAQASARSMALELARILGSVAASMLRVDGLKNQVAEQREGITLAKARVDSGYGMPLDLDRLEIEMNRVEQQVIANEGEVLSQLATCSAVLRLKCAPFASTNDARAFLVAWTDRALAVPPDASIANRPDVRALSAYTKAATAEGTLARAQAVPDPTVRLGYMRDQFVVAGNQQNSLSLSVSLPITVFDHGQALNQAAEAKATRYQTQRDTLIGSSHVRAEALRQAVLMQQRRKETMEGQILPRARGVLDDLLKAAKNRLIPFTEVIQARRTVNELLIQQVESYAEAFDASIDLLAEVSSG
jgi:cobalt-zinc-cadmium efflux system outer membrane protein